jgi:hypothetical protein
VWHVPLAQVWTHYKIRKLNMWTLSCNVCINFLNNQIWKENMLELNGNPSSVTMFSTDFSFQNLVFGNLFGFRLHKSFKNQYFPYFESKSYQINSNKFFSSRSFQEHQKHIPIFPKFSAMIILFKLWKNHSIFKNFCTTSPNVMEPSPWTPPCQQISQDSKNMIWSITIWWIS